MELKLYRVTLDIESEQTDMDCCPCWGWETEFVDLFPTKGGAIRVCQSKFDKRPTNDYVRSVHAEVCEITVTDKGQTGRKRIYNKFKRQ